MRACALLTWAACLLAVALAALRFAFVATVPERLLTLAVLALAGVFALRNQK